MGIGRRMNLTGRPNTRPPGGLSARCPRFRARTDEILWSVERERDEFSNVVTPVLVKSTGRAEHLVIGRAAV
jgi:hypothetical protein